MTLTVPVSARWRGTTHAISVRMNGYPALSGQAFNSSSAWGTQYRAIYLPVRVPFRSVVREMAYFSSSTSTGNVDVGIYDEAGTRLVSSGSTLKVSNAYRTVEVTDTTIGPGLYYLALNNDTTTDTFSTFSSSAPMPASCGVLTQTLGSLALPATATWAVDNTLAFFPEVVAYLVTEF